MLSFWDRSLLLKQGRERATGEKLKRLNIILIYDLIIILIYDFHIFLTVDLKL